MTDTIETNIDQVVAALGKYYGAISRDDFTAMIYRRGAPAAPFEIPDPTPGRLAARAILDISEGGLTTAQLIQQLDDLVGTNSESNDIPGLIKICYEPDVIPLASDRARVVLREDSQPLVGNGSQGARRQTDDASQSCSVRYISGVRSSTTVDGAAASINLGGISGDSGDVSLSVIQVFSNRLSTPSRDMGALTLFMNSIPTLEMSRAVPFIDVTLIQQGSHTSPDAAGQNRISSLSLGQFFLGNAAVTEETTAHTIFTANDEVTDIENRRNPEYTTSRRDENGNEIVAISPIATAGMELFTTPQTLINSDEEHVELDGFAEDGELQYSRQAPVIDKFRPLMSLLSLTFSVAPSGGMMSYKSGKMKLVVHDRSRLSEVSALVKPSRYGTTHLVVEYGWSHPDAPVHGSLGPVNADNLYGSLIGALRAKEKYQVVNSSFDFDDTGQVNVELSISMLSNRSMRQVQIGLGFENSNHYNDLRRTTELIEHLRGRLSSETAQSIFGEGDILGALTNPSGAVTPLSRDLIRQISRITRAARNSQQPELNQLGAALTDLVGTNGRGGQAEALRNSARGTISSRVVELSSRSDPFFVAENRSGAAGVISSSPGGGYVSLGKVLATFVGIPLASCGQFKDVQLIFYNFNDKAGYMANRNIATFPIEISDFRSVLERELAQLISMPVESFVNFISTYFISDPGAAAYGFSSMYGNRSRENTEQRQLQRQFRDDSPGQFNRQQEILQGAYGNRSADLEFKHPTVNMTLESIPVRNTPDQTILRIHITDSQATAHATLQSFLEASSGDSIGLINTESISVHQALNRSRAPDENDPESSSVADIEGLTQLLQAAIDDGLLEQFPRTENGVVRGGNNDGRRIRYRLKGGFGALKSFVMRTVPSMRYGEGSSGIISANVQSMSDPALTTVNMQRQGQNPESPTGSREQGVPLTVTPVECTLETIGCPLWNFGQQVFIDFGTGTTIDAIYGVTGVDHTLSPGEFKSTVKLTPLNSYARYVTLSQNIENAMIAVAGIRGEDLTIPSTVTTDTIDRRDRQGESESIVT